MQLREVGKLAVYPWEMQWLQRPSCWDLPRVDVFTVEAALCHWVFPSGVDGPLLWAPFLWQGLITCGVQSPTVGHPGGYLVAHMELLLCRGI